MNISEIRIAVKELRCEYSINPLGIDTPQPRFSWILESSQRGQMQSAYQVLVAGSEEKLKGNLGDKWDSGKVNSDRSVNVAYRGKALASGEKCWWKVRCWDKQDKVSAYSKPATFEMGLLNKSDWKGKWIGAKRGTSSPLLRKAFTIDKQIKRATVYICGLGYYELYINGRKVGDHVLDPGNTYYHNDQRIKLGSRVLYVTHDVTDHMKAGRNAVGVMLGHGWYSAEADIPPSPSHREPYGDRPRLILQMNVEFTDGRTSSVVSDKSWKTAAGPVTYNDYSNGETYDARLDKPGWDTPGHDDSDWDQAAVLDGPSGKMVAQMMPPIRVMKTFKPVRLLSPKKGVYVYDFGQNFSGWTRLRISGRRGTKVTLKHGARVYKDGSLDARSNLYILGCTHIARQTDTYILKGEGEEVWEPRFTMHGFRYAEITGLPGKPTLENLEGRHARSAVETVGRFACSNELINRIHRAACWTFMSSMQSFPQDAADRSERVGWLGDPIPEDFMLNYDTAAYWTKWADDLSDAQKPNGDLPIVCPLHWRRTWNGYGWMPVWKSTYPIVVWGIHQHYRDRRILREHYDGIKRLVGFLTSRSRGHILSGGLGDHMEPQRDGTVSSSPRHTPSALSSTAYYYFDTWILGQAAKILGKTEDAKRYKELAEQIKAAFNRKFFDKTTNQYATGSQTSNALALYLRMVPKERIDAVVKNLVDDITIKHKGHLSTGMIGANALAQALPEYGRADVMYTVATRTTFPGWGYMISKGATTLWESWDGNPEMRLSYNMKLHGSVDKFFYKALAGIGPASPGFKTINIKPCVVGDLTFAQASIKTVRGVVSSSWKKTDNSLALDVTIPVNSRAKVSVPRIGLKNITVKESGKLIWKAGKFVKSVSGINAGTETSDYVTFDVGSGSYVFQLTSW